MHKFARERIDFDIKFKYYYYTQLFLWKKTSVATHEENFKKTVNNSSPR